MHNYLKTQVNTNIPMGSFCVWARPMTEGVIMGSANDRRRYTLTPSVIGRAHTQNDPVCFHIYVTLEPTEDVSTVYPKKYAHGCVVLCFVVVIGIDHDTVCAGVVGTAIRNSTSCAGRRAAACGRAGRHNECCSGLQYQPRQHRPYKWSISILPRSQFTKSKRNLRFRRLVPLFVPIGVCVATHDDGTASDVTIGM